MAEKLKRKCDESQCKILDVKELAKQIDEED